MCRAKINLFLTLLVCVNVSARAAETNSLVWQTNRDRVSADIRSEALWPLLEDIAHQTGWQIFVEPDISQNASVKFQNLPAGEALRKLLGNLNYALVPETNGPRQLYVFTTTIHNATQRVAATPAKAAPMRHVPNELLVKLKPGADIDALAKSLGAKVVGRNDKLGIYRLQFGDAAATDDALASLKNNSDVAAVDYNYIFDPPPTPQQIASAPNGPVTLTLDPGCPSLDRNSRRGQGGVTGIEVVVSVQHQVGSGVVEQLPPGSRGDALFGEAVGSAERGLVPVGGCAGGMILLEILFQPFGFGGQPGAGGGTAGARLCLALDIERDQVPGAQIIGVPAFSDSDCAPRRYGGSDSARLLEVPRLSIRSRHGLGVGIGSGKARVAAPRLR